MVFSLGTGGEVQTAEVGGNRPSEVEMYSAGYKAALVQGAVIVSSVLIVSAYFFNSIYKEGVEKGYKEGVEKGYKEGFETGYSQGYLEGTTNNGYKLGQGIPVILSGSSEDNVKLGTMAILAVTVISLTLISKCFGLCASEHRAVRPDPVLAVLNLAAANAALLGANQRRN